MFISKRHWKRQRRVPILEPRCGHPSDPSLALPVLPYSSISRLAVLSSVRRQERHSEQATIDHPRDSPMMKSIGYCIPIDSIQLYRNQNASRPTVPQEWIDSKFPYVQHAGVMALMTARSKFDGFPTTVTPSLIPLVVPGSMILILNNFPCHECALTMVIGEDVVKVTVVAFQITFLTLRTRRLSTVTRPSLSHRERPSKYWGRRELKWNNSMSSQPMV